MKLFVAAASLTTAAVLLSATAVAAQPSADVCLAPPGGAVQLLTVPEVAAQALIDHAGAYRPRVFFADADGDGFGNAAASVTACLAPAGTVENADDCDDSSATTYLGAPDICGNGIDESCSGGDALCSSYIDGWRVTASRIEAGAAPGTIVGSVHFEKVDPPDTSDVRAGGACYVADLAPHASCTKDADCSQYAVPFRGGFGYCASPDGSGEPRRCWIRPGGGEYCGTRGDQHEGRSALPQVSDAVVAPGEPARPRWMILGCLAKRGFTCGSTDSSVYVRSQGPARPAP